jgi:hypothetical protein
LALRSKRWACFIMLNYTIPGQSWSAQARKVSSKLEVLISQIFYSNETEFHFRHMILLRFYPLLPDVRPLNMGERVVVNKDSLAMASLFASCDSESEENNGISRISCLVSSSIIHNKLSIFECTFLSIRCLTVLASDFFYSVFFFVDNLQLLSSKNIQQLKPHSRSRDSEAKGNQTLMNKLPELICILLLNYTRMFSTQNS